MENSILFLLLLEFALSRAPEQVDFEKRKLWLGHSDIGTTGNIYSHLGSHSKVQTGAAIYDALTD